MKAVIFDMDGVVVDSELQWELAETELFRKLIPLWRREHHHKIVGLGVEDLYHFLVREYSMTAAKEHFLKECHDLAEVVYGERVALTPGFKELLDDIRRRRLPVALASSSPKAWISIVLRRFGLASSFDALACADDVPPGKTKPEPDLYLLALRGLGLKAEECIAIEDSAFGVRAAKRAGLTCAALRNGANQAQDLSEADFELAGFGDVTLETLRGLAQRATK